MYRSTIAVAESAPSRLVQCFVASISLGLVKEAIVHAAATCSDGADLRLFQLVARKQPYLLSLSVQSL